MSRNTQNQLTEALKRLMTEKNLDSITVQELADEANVNKKTFYYHYHCMSDLLVWMYASRFNRLIDTEGVSADNWTDHLRKVSAEIRKDKAYISAIYASDYAPGFRQSISRMFDRAVEKYVKSAMARWEMKQGQPLALSETCMAYLVSYHSMALFGLVEQWFHRGMKETDEEFARLVHMLTNDSMDKAFSLMNAINTL